MAHNKLIIHFPQISMPPFPALVSHFVSCPSIFVCVKRRTRLHLQFKSTENGWSFINNLNSASNMKNAVFFSLSCDSNALEKWNKFYEDKNLFAFSLKSKQEKPKWPILISNPLQRLRKAVFSYIQSGRKELTNKKFSTRINFNVFTG